MKGDSPVFFSHRPSGYGEREKKSRLLFRTRARGWAWLQAGQSVAPLRVDMFFVLDKIRKNPNLDGDGRRYGF